MPAIKRADETNDRERVEGSPHATRLDLSLALLICLCPFMAVATGRVLSLAAPGAEAPAPATTIDPNHAPWWELTVLPRIGPTRARDIVAFRQAHRENQAQEPRLPAFETTSDLARVRGIGPKTVARISRFLETPLE